MSIVKDIVGGITGSAAAKAAGEAAGAQVGATREAIAEQRRQFEIAQRQAEPFRQAELAALQQREPLRAEALRQQAALTGLGGQEAQQQAFAQFQESPGQAFLRQRGEQATLRGASATGGLGGARVQEALQRQGIGFAQQDLQSQLARLGGFTGAQGAGTTQNLAAMGAQQAQQVGGLISQAGQAQASGILGAQQARSAGLGNILGIGARAGLGAMTPGVGAGAGALAGLLRF